MMKKAGDYVVIEFTVMPKTERAPGLPEDTAELDLLARVKGHLKADARVGEEVQVVTMSGRELSGILTDQDTAATHSYGPPVDVLLEVREEVRELLKD
ncbi:MAG TPA: 2-amino-4-ketopentanoate thiolase [Fastidiosipila sp.]|nr:2-amino-4-ketopentanoate thiolase [Fastidiosipila sp.]